MQLRQWTPILVGLTILSACGGGDEASRDRGQARLDAMEQRLGTLEQRLAAIDKALPAGERLRGDLNALEQRVGAIDAKVTAALEMAKKAPAPAAAQPRAKRDVAPSPARPDAAERRAQLGALMTEYRRRLDEVRRQQQAGTNPMDQMAARRAVREWYIARRRAILAGQPLAD
jgi:BMFP domain-containing protein YqiC